MPKLKPITIEIDASMAKLTAQVQWACDTIDELRAQVDDLRVIAETLVNLDELVSPQDLLNGLGILIGNAKAVLARTPAYHTDRSDHE